MRPRQPPGLGAKLGLGDACGLERCWSRDHRSRRAGGRRDLLSGSTPACSDIDRLVDESTTDFADIRESVIDATAGEWSTTYSVDGASSCSIIVDAEQVLYLCTWEHELASSASQESFESEATRVRSCLDGAREREDASVNHPDFWASKIFCDTDGEVAVSIKDKGLLGKTLVTVGVSSFVNP